MNNAGEKVLSRRYRTLGLVGIACFAAMLLVLPYGMPTAYHKQVVNLAIIYVVLVVGYNYALGLTGLLSFAQIGFFAIGAYTSALLSVKGGVPFWIALPSAGVVSGLFGLVVGVPTIRIKGHYLAMVTLAFSEVVRIVLTNWKSVTGGGDGIIGIPDPSIGFIHISTKTGFYYLALGITAVMLLIAYRIDRSRYGRMFRAVRDTELAAEVMGINSTKIKVLAFVLSAVYAGIAGSLYAHSYNYISPEVFGVGQIVMVLAMLLVGGAGTISGAVLGAIILTVLPEYLRFVKEYYMFLFGVAIFLIVLFMPDGISGLFTHFKGWQGKLFPSGK